MTKYKQENKFLQGEKKEDIDKEKLEEEKKDINKKEMKIKRIIT